MREHYAIPDDVLVAHLDDEAVLLHMGTKRYFRLNATGSVVWWGLEAGLAEEALVETLCRRFEVDARQAREAVARFFRELTMRDLIRSAGPDGEVR